MAVLTLFETLQGYVCSQATNSRLDFGFGYKSRICSH